MPEKKHRAKRKTLERNNAAPERRAEKRGRASISSRGGNGKEISSRQEQKRSKGREKRREQKKKPARGKELEEKKKSSFSFSRYPGALTRRKFGDEGLGLKSHTVEKKTSRG